ncbi:MAG: type II secretion system protein GspM [Thiogranum sp.]|nr:type II secretion system protein GspM [Thiogranum sp.]
MKEWFLGLDARERKLVAGGAAVLVLLLLYVLIIDPLVSGYSELKENVASQKQSLLWMQQASRQVQALRGTAGANGAAGLGGRSLMAVVDQSARTDGLGQAIKRIEPEGSKSVRVWLESVSFDQMVLWLGKLTQTYQIETSIITIEPQGAGRVNARLTLLESGA